MSRAAAESETRALEGGNPEYVTGTGSSVNLLTGSTRTKPQRRQRASRPDHNEPHPVPSMILQQLSPPDLTVATATDTAALTPHRFRNP
jgi:hypothetical protein